MSESDNESMPITNEWLPVGNDVRIVVAALESQFFNSAVKVMVIPTDIPVTTPYRPLAPEVNAVGTMEISDITPEQGRKIANAIYTPARAPRWGDYLTDDGTIGGFGYRWNKISSFQCHLIKREGDTNWRVMFVILYGDNTDIGAILDHSRNVAHQFIMRTVGLKSEQLRINTYIYNPHSGWVLDPKLK